MVYLFLILKALINVLSFFVSAIDKSVPWIQLASRPSKRKMNRQCASDVSKQFNFKA